MTRRPGPDPQSEKLRDLICAYAKAPLEDMADGPLGAIDKALAAAKSAGNAKMILARNDQHSLLHDAIIIPLSPKTLHENSQETQRAKIKILLPRLIAFCHEAIRAGQITQQDYAHLFESTTPDGDTLISLAIKSGDKETFNIVFSELRSLRMASHTTETRYMREFLSPAHDGYTPLHAAVASGDIDIYRAVVQELKRLEDDTLEPMGYAHQFTRRSNDHHKVNLLHSAAMTNNPELLRAVIADLREALTIDGHFDAQRYEETLLATNRTDQPNLLKCATCPDDMDEPADPEMANIVRAELEATFGAHADTFIQRMESVPARPRGTHSAKWVRSSGCMIRG